MEKERVTPGDLPLKVALATRVNELIAERGLSQIEAAVEIGMTQPKVSQINRYRLHNISVGRLLQALTALDQRIEIVIGPSPERTIPTVRIAA